MILTDFKRITRIILALSVLYIACNWLNISIFPNMTKEKSIISRRELLDLMKSETFHLIDVRSSIEVSSGKIPNAKNIPGSLSNLILVNELFDAFQMSDKSFNGKYGFSKPIKSEKIVFYCRSGARAQTATNIAKKSGYTNVLNYRGSWNEWSSFVF